MLVLADLLRAIRQAALQVPAPSVSRSMPSASSPLPSASCRGTVPGSDRAVGQRRGPLIQRRAVLGQRSGTADSCAVPSFKSFVPCCSRLMPVGQGGQLAVQAVHTALQASAAGSQCIQTAVQLVGALAQHRGALLLQGRAAAGSPGDSAGEQRGLLGQLAGTALQLGQSGHQGIRSIRKMLRSRLQGGQGRWTDRPAPHCLRPAWSTPAV